MGPASFVPITVLLAICKLQSVQFAIQGFIRVKMAGNASLAQRVVVSAVDLLNRNADCVIFLMDTLGLMDNIADFLSILAPTFEISSMWACILQIGIAWLASPDTSL